MSITEFFHFQLTPESLEQNYREAMFAEDKVLIKIIIVFAVLVIIGFVILDFNYLQKSSLYISVISRLFTIFISLLAIFQISRQSMIKIFDRTITLWSMVLVTHVLVVAAVRQGDYATIVAYDILVIFGNYLALPIPLRLQIMPTFFLTFGSIFLWTVYKAPPWETLETVATLSAYFAANIFGIYFSCRFNRVRRNQFVQFKHEMKIKTELESALSEVNVLRGIIPICSFCKNIRNDEGYYEKIEAYFHRHLESDFSHTICPDCLAKYYPELNDSEKNL